MNIYDIAKQCEVSIATVSRVLNGSDKVRPATRDKILAVMKENNYSPSSMARGLGTGYTRMVGVLWDSDTDSHFAPAIALIEQTLRQQGMSTPLRTVSATEDKQKALSELAQQGVDGILVAGFGLTDEDEAALYTAASRAPVMVVGANINVPGVYCVQCDERRAIAGLVADLFLRQRRNILLLHDGDTLSNREKVEGYREGYAAAGYTAEDSRIIQVEPRLDAVNTCIKQLLMQRVSFDAVIGTTDMLALGAQKALQRTGLSMPVIGCNNSPLAQCVTPELSSIDNHAETLCVTAAELLCRCLQGEEVSPYTVIPADLAERDTFRR